jgi:hypothetical protein
MDKAPIKAARLFNVFIPCRSLERTDASNSRDVDFLQRPLIRRLKPTAMDKAQIMAASCSEPYPLPFA